MTDPPTVREKNLENDFIKLKRIANPVHHVQQNVIDVNYELQIVNKLTGKAEVIHETHHMRYLFDTEINWLCELFSFQNIAAFEWMTEKHPSLPTWNTVFICQAK